MEISSLKDELKKWYEANCKNGNLAWSNLAKASGLSTSHIRKIAVGEVAKPRFDTARRLCSALFSHNSDATAVYLKEIYPKEAQTWFLGNPERKELPSEVYDISRDALAHRLFYLALTDSAKVSDLENTFGKEKVSQKLSLLEEKELVKVTSEGVLTRAEGTKFSINTSPSSVISSFRQILAIMEEKFLDEVSGIAEIDRSTNRLDYLYLGLNVEGSNLLDAQLQKNKQELYEILTDPKYKGDIPRFVNIATGRFDTK